MLAPMPGRNRPKTSRSKRRLRPRGRPWPKGTSGNPARQWRRGQSGNPRGRWEPGECGNERGRPLCPVVAARALLCFAPLVAVERLSALARDRRAGVAIKACVTVLDLAFGKAGAGDNSDNPGGR